MLSDDNPHFLHLGYGLCVGANRRIPELPAAPDGAGRADPDIAIWFGERSLGARGGSPGARWYASDDVTDDGRPGLEVWQVEAGARWELRYADGPTFVVDRAGTRIEARWPPAWTFRDVSTYLLGPIMGVALRLRGQTCLHASAVAIHGRAAVFVGASEAGKSSLAAALARLGYAVLSDDIAPLTRAGSRWLVQPGYPRIRLRPASLDVVERVPSRLPPLPRPVDGERVHLDLTQPGYRFQPTALPLGAIYLLGDRIDAPRAPFITAVPRSAGLMALVAEAYAARVLDAGMRAAEFETLGALAQAVPLRRIHAHVDPNRMARLCAAIVEDCACVKGDGAEVAGGGRAIIGVDEDGRARRIEDGVADVEGVGAAIPLDPAAWRARG